MSDSRRIQRVKVEPGIWKRTTVEGVDVFEITWRDATGSQRRRRVSGALKSARAALAEEQVKRARGEKVAADPRLRFDEAAEAWWQARVVKPRPATQNAYGAGLTHLRRELGRRRMTDVTPTDIAAYVSRKQKEGLKGWTIKGHLTVLSAIFTYSARHLGLVGVNPVGLLDRVERPSIEDQRPKRVLSADELLRLLEAVDEHWRLLFEVAAETGGRLAEVLGLAWEDVELDAATLTYRVQLDRSGRRVPLKTTRSRRCLEVTAPLASKLRAYKLASAHSSRHDLVFCSREGRGLDHRNIGGRVLARAVKRAGLEAVEQDGNVVLPAPTFHSLRHSHGSALIAAGWDIEEVSARLGHANVGTTQRSYVHAYDAARRSEQRRDRLASMYAQPAAM